MRSSIEYFIKNPIAANLLMIGIFIVGVLGYGQLKSSSFPEVESQFILIQAVYPGASPEEIEEGVITKIEENLKGVTGVLRVTSSSSENAGSVTIEILKGYDMDVALQDVQNQVNSINSFPVNMEPLLVYKRENLARAISFALSGNVDLRTLKEFSRTVEEELRAKDGISKFTITGFPEEEIEVSFREKDLRAYQMTFGQAAIAIRNANLEVTGGTVKGEEEELLVRARNKKYYAEDLRNIIVRSNPNGTIIKLHQVATIKDKWADNPSRSYMNGNPSVIVTVQRTLTESQLDISKNVLAYLEEFNEKHSVVEATLIRDESAYLKERIDLLKKNGIAGFVLVCVLLAMFLNWRLAFWVALAIPISFAGMFALGNLVGLSINFVSSFGMIMVLGILVDDGIVIGENIYKKFEEGLPAYEAAVEGTMEVLPAVFSAILTTMIAFAAFFFIDGNMGVFFSSMSIVIICSLLFSLVEGAFILPAHIAHSKSMNHENKKGILVRYFDKAMSFLRDRLYVPVLKFALKNKAITLASLIGLFFISIGMVQGGFIKTTFFPQIPADNMNINLKMPAGTPEEVTIKWLDHIEGTVQKVNNDFKEYQIGEEKSPILKVEKNIGPSTYEGNLSITFSNSSTRPNLSNDQIVNAIRDQSGTIVGAEEVQFGAVSFFGKPVSISLVGKDLDRLNRATAELKAELINLAELTDVTTSNQEGLREINISLKENANYLGLNLQEVINQVHQGFFGAEVQRLQRGRDEVRVWVRYEESGRQSISQLENMHIRFVDGREYRLGDIANLDIEKGIIAITHVDGSRSVTVEANTRDEKVSTTFINGFIQGQIMPKILAKYPGISVEKEGQERDIGKTGASGAKVMPVILLAMFFIIALTFRSIGQSLAVYAIIPFGIIGVIWGHFALGYALSMPSGLGMLALLGILVNDALVYITTFNNLIKKGTDFMTAVYETSVSRFRPIVLTSLTTIAGLLPLLAEKSRQAEFLKPMAISVSFGLMFVTVTILILLPVILVLISKIKIYSSYAWDGVKPAPESVEPAMPNRHTNYLIWAIGGLLTLAVILGAVAVTMMLVNMI